MKNLFLLSIVLVVSQYAMAQNDSGTRGFVIGGQYVHEFVLGGYVQVREWELPGDKLHLKDLGMDNYPAFQLYLGKELSGNRQLSLKYDQFFFSGKATFDSDIAYNGTIIDGTKGTDVSPTVYYRITASYFGNLYQSSKLDLQYAVALVYDHLKFYVDGDLSPESTRSEVFEQFGRQAFPYPSLGIRGKHKIDGASFMNYELMGTYIPKFKSFFTESGHIDLKYNTLLADVKYARMFSRWEAAVGARVRHMYLFQESKEDTNVIRIGTAGPYISLTYGF